MIAVQGPQAREKLGALPGSAAATAALKPFIGGIRNVAGVE